MDLDNFDIHVTCDCGHEFTEKLARLKSENGTNCPACNMQIRTTEQSVREASGKVDRAIEGAVDQLREAFKNAGFKT